MSRTLEISLASLVALMAGFFGFIFLFSDPTTGAGGQAFWYVVHFFAPGLLIGLLFPRAWLVAALVAWAPMAAGVGNLAFRAIGLVVPMPDHPAVQVVVRDGSLDIDPEVIDLAGSTGAILLHMRNEGTSAHEIVVMTIDAGQEFPTPPPGSTGIRFQMPRLDAGETREAIVEVVGPRVGLWCAIPGHAQRGEVGDLDIRGERP